nr:MAG TPA: hypothetical protein [Caudoviricetes sp.]
MIYRGVSLSGTVLGIFIGSTFLFFFSLSRENHSS